MAVQQHQLANQCSIKAAIHHVLLTVEGGGWSLPHTPESELTFALRVERSYYSTIVALSFVVDLQLKRVIVVDHASQAVIRTDGEMPSRVASADQIGWRVVIEPWNEDHICVVNIAIDEIGCTMWSFLGSRLRVLKSKVVLSSAKSSAHNRRRLPTKVGQRHQVRVELICLEAVLDFRDIKALYQRSPQCDDVGEVRMGRFSYCMSKENTAVTEL